MLYVKDADEVVLWCSVATSFRDWTDGSSVDERAKADDLLERAVARGWVMHHNMDVWRTTVPVHGPNGIWPMGGAWLSTQLWEHWLFTHDRAALARSYPVMKGAAEFFLDVLVEDPATGNLTVVPGVSPENKPKCRRDPRNGWTRGASSDAQILRDLFAAVLESAKILGREAEDADVLNEIAGQRARLEPLRIGRWGQLQEWTEDLDDPGDHHRHVSHLYCVYPSAQVTPDEPALFKAAHTPIFSTRTPRSRSTATSAVLPALRRCCSRAIA